MTNCFSVKSSFVSRVTFLSTNASICGMNTMGAIKATVYIILALVCILPVFLFVVVLYLTKKSNKQGVRTVTLSLKDYWMGRDILYQSLLTKSIRDSAKDTVGKITRLVALYEKETSNFIADWASGWRPSIVNDATSNSAKWSKHLTAQAGDVRDPSRQFAKWCIRNIEKLEDCGLWMEDCRWTPTWVHLQSVPPKSGNRVYIPSTKPPLVGYPT